MADPVRLSLPERDAVSQKNFSEDSVSFRASVVFPLLGVIVTKKKKKTCSTNKGSFILQ